MKIGTYYYPEQWPREQWERDFDNIAAMGMKIVHLGEFAWFDLEPAPGYFRLDWLEECVELAAARGLEVILCTPTAAPPVWLGDQYPETLPTNRHGDKGRFGSRRHYTPTSRRMQEASFRIVTALAEKFGDHPAVIGWQIDNEIGGPFDQSESTHKAFRAWLLQKYSTIENLNRAWACQFWNTYYQTFEQIMMPPSRDPEYGNPQHHLDASRFWSQAWADYVKLQADILKRHVGQRWITTNFMPLYPEIDPGDLRDTLTLWSWDTYPAGGFGSDHKNENFRLANPEQMEFVHDQMLAYNGRWALMEVQPGQINWSGYPVKLLPGAVRLWLWTALAHDAEFITVYRYRQPRFGIEMWHDGLTLTDGITLSRGGEDFKQVAAEVASIANEVDTTQTHEAEVGLLLDFDQLWHFATLPQAKKWSQGTLLQSWHAAASRFGHRVRILFPNQPWPEGLKIVIVAGQQLVDDEVLDRMTRFVAGGGQLIVTCRTGLMDRDGQFYEGPWGEPILSLIGGEIAGYDSLPEATYGHVTFAGKNYRWTIWADQVKPDDGTETLGTFADMFYAGTAAITYKAHADGGGVTYCGVYGDRDLHEAVFASAAARAGLPASALPDRVRVVRRAGLTIALNYNDQPVTLDVPAGARLLLGTATLPPAGVMVWKM